MAQPTNTYSSYDAVGNREDLADVIYDISPTETPFLSEICGKGKAKNTTHEWQTDALAAAASNAKIEGDDVTAAAASPTARAKNYTQVAEKTAIVTSTQNAIDSAGRANEMAYQMDKKSKELKRDMEFDLLSNQAPAAGDDSNARKLRPLCGWITTNASRGSGGANGSDSASATDGTKRTFTETLLAGVIEDAWEAGGNPDIILCGGNHKRAIGAFTGDNIVARRNDKKERTLMSGVDVYMSDFGGTLTVVPDRFMRKDGGVAREVFVLDSSMYSVDYLQSFKTEKLAKTGLSEKRMISCEYTLCAKNEASSGVIADLN